MDDLASDTSVETVDLEASSDRIGAMLGEDLVGKMSEPTERPGLEPPVTPEPVATQPPPAPIQTYEVPKSWKREMHDHWGKITPEAQSYIIERERQLLDGFQSFRPIQDAIAPHQDFLSRANIPPAQAVAALLSAQRRLTEGSVEQRKAAYQELGRNLKLIEEAAQQNSQPVDPAIQTLQQKIDAITQQVQAERDFKVNQIRTENQHAVNAFADATNADGTKLHPHFDEVAEDMAILIKSTGLSLQDAYDRAVRMNPVTFEKEKARLLTEAEAKWRENARLSALPKRKAASPNIQSNGDGPEPTEPLGSIEDTIKREHKKILTRA